MEKNNAAVINPILLAVACGIVSYGLQYSTMIATVRSAWYIWLLLISIVAAMIMHEVFGYRRQYIGWSILAQLLLATMFFVALGDGSLGYDLSGGIVDYPITYFACAVDIYGCTLVYAVGQYFTLKWKDKYRDKKRKTEQT